jgi:hypothetical protein
MRWFRWLFLNNSMKRPVSRGLVLGLEGTLEKKGFLMMIVKRHYSWVDIFCRP